MKAGWRTSEFWIASHWALIGAGSVATLLSLPWPAALCALPAVCVVVWMAGVVTNNYTENRFQLKARQMPAPDGPAEPARTMGFGRYVAPEGESPDGEDEE